MLFMNFCGKIFAAYKLLGVKTTERLQKYMAKQGIASRRNCEEIIASGRVKVNGKVVTQLGTTIDPNKDTVHLDGRKLKNISKPIYIMLNKPRGYISSIKDPRGRKIVTDLIPDIIERLFPVGRLDYNSEGLMILTNDGDFAYHLTHPSYNVPKTYRVRVKGQPSEKDIICLSEGIVLEDGPTAPAKIFHIETKEGNALYEITISEGKNKQIRRMFEKIGFEVIRLKRIKVGNLSLGDLKSGQYRHLLSSEVRKLKK